MLRKGLLVVAILSLAGVANAQAETEAEEEGPWSGELSLGYLSTSGNTETTNYKTTFGIGYEKNDWEHRLAASANGADDSDVTTAESYQIGWRSAYSWTEHDFVFGTIDWRKDRFAGVTEQTSYALNYGRRVIDNDKHMLALGIGAGYRNSDRSDGTSAGNAIGRGSLLYSWAFSETSGFDQSVIVESGSDNAFIESVSAVRAKLIGGFNLVFSYTIKQNSDVPVGSEKTDKLTAVSIEYEF
jgi:putative salt-induced outer membrane protein